MIHTDSYRARFQAVSNFDRVLEKGRKEGREDGDEVGSSVGLAISREPFYPSLTRGFSSSGRETTPLGIPEGEARAALAQAFRWNVLSIGPCSRLSRYTSLVCEQILDSERAPLDTGKGIARTAG